MEMLRLGSMVLSILRRRYLWPTDKEVYLKGSERECFPLIAFGNRK